MLLGVAGPMQSGKQENHGVFEGCGVRVVDLNDIVETARICTPTVRDRYEQLGLADTLDDNGSRSAAYYQRIMKAPSLHDDIMAVELPVVAQQVAYLLSVNEHPHLAVSWGYFHDLLPLIQTVDHILLFVTDQQVWFNRLRRRAAQRGMPGAMTMPDETLWALIRATKMDPRMIDSVLTAQGIPLTVVDTSDETWGAANVRLALESLLSR
jgi:hypothetical protein